jgi:catechol 2,3-dioxygenase-like lactoylglutathione lyase family enzyme
MVSPGPGVHVISRFRVAAAAALATAVLAVSAFVPAKKAALSPRFNHVMLFVTNLDSSITFYTTAFNLQVAQRITELTVTGTNGTPTARPVKMALLRFPGQEFVLELSERPAPAAPGPPPFYQHLGIDVRDIAAAAERVARAGGRSPSAIQTVSTSTGTVAKNMFFRGPSGELLELMQVVAGDF